MKTEINYEPIKEVEFSKDWALCGKGSFGLYYRIDDRKGIKILKKRVTDYSSGVMTYEDLYPAAVREFICLAAAKNTNIVPKAHGVIRVVYKNSSKRSVGIVMEHINGTTLKNASKEFKKWFKEKHGKRHESPEDFLWEKLKKNGFRCEDLHDRNIMVKKTKNGFKLFAIDMDPEFIY